MIVAVLIVKNESHVLERCLRSVLPHVDGVYISDTGSTDREIRSMILITDMLETEFNKTIMFHPNRWEGFAESRNTALDNAARLLRCTHDDWLFMIDADDYVIEWEGPPGDTRHAGFLVTMRGGCDYPRIQLFRPGIWRYRGVVHEYPECTAPAHTVGKLNTVVASTREGARGKDPETYKKDAKLLLEAIANGKDPDLLPRYTFYLAQSFRDAGEDAKASKWYCRRAAMTEGYAQERYVSLLENMRLKNTYDGWDDGGYEMAAQMELAQTICPERRECVYQLMRYMREYQAWPALIHLYEHYAVGDTVPTGLFIEPQAYTWGMHDEASIAYYYVGNYEASVNAGIRALARLPDLSLTAKRIADNAMFAVDKRP